MLLLIGGLSGAGKSTLGEYLKEYRAFRWIELDDPGKDVVDELNIRPQWEAFYCAGDPIPLREVCPGNTVVTVPSRVIFRAPRHTESDEEVRVRYLWGPREKCFRRAHERRPHVVSQKFWDDNNEDMLAFLESSDCPTDRRIAVFDDAGTPRGCEELALAVLREESR